MSAPRHLRLRLIPVAGACWAVALPVTSAPVLAVPIAATLWTAGLVAIVASAFGAYRRRRRRRSTWRVVLILGLLAAAASASHVALAEPGRTEAASLALEGGRAVTVTAIVTGKVERRMSGDYAFDALATRIATGTVGEDVRLETVVRVQREDVDHWDRLEVGAVVTADGTARAAPAGNRAVLSVSAARGLQVQEPAFGVLAVAGALRDRLVASTAGLPSPGAGLIPGLAVGDTSAVTAELDASMKNASLSHLTAVSGANCALVVGLAFAAAAVLGASRRLRVMVGLGALAGFVVLVTPEPSVVRAAAMAGVAMLGVLLGRTGVGMAILALAVAALLVFDPWLSGSLGFALSTVATASLLLLARPLADGMTRRMPRALAVALAVPIAAQLACGPLLILLTPSVPVYGVLANLLAAPAAPLATVLGLAACLAAPLPWLQSGLTAIAWLPAAWIAGTAATFNALPGAQLAWLEGPAGAIALAGLGGAVGILLVLPAGGRGRKRMLRLTAGTIVAVVVGGGLGGAALSSVAGRWTLPPEWAILACDVGQGDAVLLRSSGAVALIDTGPDPAVLSACLARAGIERIDLLVLTHFDLDHVGGAAAVIGRADAVLHGPAPDDAAGSLLHAFTTAGAEVRAASSGLRGTVGTARWRVVWPPPRSGAFPAGNDASVIVEVGGGGIPSSLFLGDLSASPQRALGAAAILEPSYDLVKVAHHGSADQDPRFYQDIDPSIALITVGTDNDYGHPRDETLALLSAAGARIARTDREGMIAVWRAADGVALWRERENVSTEQSEQGAADDRVGGDR
ncbi:ComEC/Rec2 family competence protein [Microbacterium pygmaeum]|uniref:Competence protein ComEC n=1 Tax=Microbacterium pygmaeum TaxID=370764 RepID=A0A1G8ARK0_9MICO|nr:ComEC/Rec2 family competence protein [Microbacterium pygmaeum]SDH23588.1 competence protein ComEC [Microbacterium pygmaeum]